MKGTVLDSVTKLNIRNAMSTSPGTDVGDLFSGDVVYGNVLGSWIAFSRVYRKDGPVEDLGFTRYAAVYNPSNINEKYMQLDNVPEPGPVPTPTPEVKPLIVTIGGEDYETVTVEVKPKA